MKKLTFAAFIMIAVAVIGTSCTKTATTPAEAGKGKLSLELEVNNNEANDTLASTDTDEMIPSGTMIEFIMDTKDYQVMPDSNFTYEMKRWTAAVDANGMVSIELPAIAKDATVTVKYPDVSMTRTWRLNPSGNLLARDTTNTRIYERADDTYTIYEGADVKNLQLMYTLK
jgi:hypothetical protein